MWCPDECLGRSAELRLLGPSALSMPMALHTQCRTVRVACHSSGTERCARNGVLNPLRQSNVMTASSRDAACLAEWLTISAEVLKLKFRTVCLPEGLAGVLGGV